MRRSALLMILAVGGLVTLAGCDSTGLDTNCTVGCHPGPNPPHPNPPNPNPPNPNPPTPDPVKVFVELDARGTYLLTNEDPEAQPASIRPLGALNLVAGQRACFEAVGDLDLGNGLLARPNGIPVVMAVFSADDHLGASDQRYRVTGAVGHIEDVETPRTALGDLETDIAQDFNATDACVTVPAGATHVFFGTWDSYVSDNRKADGSDAYGVRVWRP